MNPNKRIHFEMSMVEAVSALSEGNPGAVMVLMEMLSKGAQIDPDAALGGVSALFFLDSLGIYGPRIWVLYKDVCNQKISRTIALLRAHQLGHLGEQPLMQTIDNAILGRKGALFSMEDVFAKVKEDLPEFKLED